MSWFNVWDDLKNKTCRYLLQRYLGQFLDEKLNLEQLNVELYNGRATVKNVELKVDSLNELFETQAWPVEVTGGTIGLITVTVPWNALMTNDSSIEMADLFICLRPLHRQNDGTSMLESMWSSVSSSMQLAQECMNQNDVCDAAIGAQNNSIDGLEKFAETIDNVLNRIKAKCSNVTIRLEYVVDGKQGIAVIVNIKKLNYKNDAEYENKTSLNSSQNITEENNIYLKNSNILATFATHNISLHDVQIYTEEFRMSYKKNLNSKRPPKTFVNSKNTRIPKRSTTEIFNLHTEHISSSIPIPIIEIRGKQIIILKMKRSEEIIGPKVILDAEFGNINLISTPRQLHLLCQFYNSFFEDNNSSTESIKQKKTPSTIELSHTDIQKYSSKMTGVLENQNIWTENYQEEHLSGIAEKADIKFDYGYCESISSSVSSNTTVTSTTKFQRKIANMDISGDISKFNIKVAAVVAVILQEDILVSSNFNPSGNPLNEKSEKDMLEIAEKFFSIFNDQFDGNKAGFENILCNKNHLCLKLSSIITGGMQQRNKNVLLLKVSVTTAMFDLYEVLENTSTSLLEFDRRDNCSKGYSNRPELSLNINSTTPFNSKSHAKYSKTKTDIDIVLGECILELDISIYDRLSAILGPSLFKSEFLISQNDHSIEDMHTDVRLSTTRFEIKLRFPIVDLSTVNDFERIPWWKKNVRLDFLLLCFHQLRFKFSLNGFEILVNEILAYYCEGSMDTKINLLKINMRTSYTSGESRSECPKITFETQKSTYCCENILTEKCNIGYSCNSKSDKSNANNIPFSSKRVCRQSDTLHSKHDISDTSETVLLPGETLELRKFCDTTMNTSKLQIKIYFPVVTIILESKQLYEIIYNRLNADLFMWVPSSPIFKNNIFNKAETKSNQSIYTVGLSDSIYVPSTIILDPYTRSDDKNSDEEADDEFQSQTDASGSIYASAQKSFHKLNENRNIGHVQSECALEVTVDKGEIIFFVPTRDTENRVLPQQYGQFTAKLNEFRIFFVDGHNSNKNLSYLCLQLKDLEVFHCGLIPVDCNNDINNIGSDLPTYMQSTFYKTPIGLTKGKGLGCNKREMFSLVIEIKKIPENKIKRLKLTTGIQKITLRYNPVPSPYSWLNQLLDFLDVMDYPISGYEPYGIITEMQLHLWDCAIDYRPRNIQYRSVIEIGTFNISSNIISSVDGCTLRFVAEDCIVSIATFDYTNICNPESKISYLSSIDLVPVLDIGLIDISLRLSDKSTNNCPQFDLRSSIQDVHLRTCSDSGSALAQLISYLANDGDIIKLYDDNENSSTSSVISSAYSDAELLQVNESKTPYSKLSEIQQERVNEQMAEAVREMVPSTDSIECYGNVFNERGIEVFYFPDENNQSKKQNPVIFPEGSKRHSTISTTVSEKENSEDYVMSNSFYINEEILETLPQIKEDLGDIASKETVQTVNNGHDDYCELAEDEKSYMSNFGIQNFKISEDPLRIVDNHFCLPNAKSDLLKSPEDFPMALTRYTLCEMTFTWHLYGGNDFKLNDTLAHSNFQQTHNTKEQKPPHMSEAYKHGVSYSKSVQFGKKPKEKLTWKTIGGCNRNHEVLVEIQLTKVRFSHELYPPHTNQASRQVLIVNEIEIRDRMQCSDINKFLYHPKSKDLPNKSNQHMVVIKALNIRPNAKIDHSEECSLNISLLPLRLHIDQVTLLFLVNFFTSFGDFCSNENPTTAKNYEKKSSSPVRVINKPVMMVDVVPEAVQDLQARRMVSTNLDLLMDGNMPSEEYCNDDTNKIVKDDMAPIFFREVVFSPEVLIRFDYHGRHVELSHGPIAGLLMGLGQLQCSEIRLQKIVYKRGILGVDKLLTYLCKEWLKDIKKNQLPNILSGVGPTYAFVQLFQGIYDLFWLPIEQFQKDGRIMRGLQLGAQSFTARTVLAALEITSRIIQLLQFTAETAFDIVSPGPTVRRPRNMRKGKRKRPHRPKDIREGVTNAYIIVKEGFNDSAHSLIETAVAEHDQKGYTGAVGAVMRQIPQLVVRPAVLATQATTNILGGVKSSLVPEAKIEAREKWKNDTD